MSKLNEKGLEAACKAMAAWEARMIYGHLDDVLNYVERKWPRYTFEVEKIIRAYQQADDGVISECIPTGIEKAPTLAEI